MSSTFSPTSFVEPDYNQEENRTPPNLNADDILQGMISANGGITKFKASKEPHAGTNNKKLAQDDSSQTPQSPSDIVESIQRAAHGYTTTTTTTKRPISTGEILFYSAIGVVVMGAVGFLLFSNRTHHEFPKRPKLPKVSNPKVEIEVEEVEEQEQELP